MVILFIFLSIIIICFGLLILFNLKFNIDIPLDLENSRLKAIEQVNVYRNLGRQYFKARTAEKKAYKKRKRGK